MRIAIAQEEGPRFGGRKGRLVAFDRLRGSDRAAARLIELVATERRVPAILLLHRSRCAAEVALARQLAMYLMHVALERTYTEVGRYFGRDRTTVTYACAQIEDLRDRGDLTGFEADVARLEAAVRGGNAEQEALRGAS